MSMEPAPVLIPCRVSPEDFREFALFDAFRRQKRWKSPLLFAVIFAAFAAVCFTAGRNVRGSGLLAVGLGAHPRQPPGGEGL